LLVLIGGVLAVVPVLVGVGVVLLWWWGCRCFLLGSLPFGLPTGIRYFFTVLDFTLLS